MADSLFDFELLDSADVLVDFDADEALNAVAAAETAQLETDQDEMAILADYVVPPNKTPEDLARDLEAMVSGVNTLSLQATEGTAVVVAPLAVATTSSPTPPASPSAPAVATAHLPAAWWVLPRLLHHRQRPWSQRLHLQRTSFLEGQLLLALISRRVQRNRQMWTWSSP